MNYGGVCRTAPATPGLLKTPQFVNCTSYPTHKSYAASVTNSFNGQAGSWQPYLRRFSDIACSALHSRSTLAFYTLQGFRCEVRLRLGPAGRRGLHRPLRLPRVLRAGNPLRGHERPHQVRRLQWVVYIGAISRDGLVNLISESPHCSGSPTPWPTRW